MRQHWRFTLLLSGTSRWRRLPPRRARTVASTSITPVAGALRHPVRCHGRSRAAPGTALGSTWSRSAPNGTSHSFLVQHPDIADVGFMTTDGTDAWFTDTTSSIGRIDGAGHLTEWTVPPSDTDASPNGLIVADGIAWFTDSTGNRIGRLDPSTGVSRCTRANRGQLPAGHRHGSRRLHLVP